MISLITKCNCCGGSIDLISDDSLPLKIRKPDGTTDTIIACKKCVFSNAYFKKLAKDFVNEMEEEE